MGVGDMGDDSNVFIEFIFCKTSQQNYDLLPQIFGYWLLFASFITNNEIKINNTINH